MMANKQTTLLVNGSERSLAIARATETSDRLAVIITPNSLMNFTLKNELEFFSTKTILTFPDLETLPFDHFSPHRDIISARLSLLGHLSTLKNTIVIVSINTLLQRIAPPDYLALHSLSLQKGQLLPLMQFREMLNKSGYRFVSEVFEHGDYAVRGSLIDLYPMGSDYPYRIDLLDDEIDSLRTFDPETQRSLESVDTIQLLPAHEFPLTPEAIQHFREKWRDRFSGNPMHCDLYQSVSEGRYAAGLEYYLPLFFDQLTTLLDYLPKHALLFQIDSLMASTHTFWQEIHSRHEQLNHDLERPILSPEEIFIVPDVLLQQIDTFEHIDIKKQPTEENFFTDLSIDYKSTQPLDKLNRFLTIQQTTGKRILLTAETLGHRESLIKLLATINIHPSLITSWTAFQAMPAASISLAIASIETGVMQDDYLIIPENQLYGQRVASRQSRQKKKTEQSDLLVRNLAELAIGDPVVHIDHGIGRYLGLQTMTIDQKTDEYLTLEYAEHHKLYVPVSSLHLISRYSGASADHAPLHHLGNPQWEKTKRKAQEKARDVAAELLALYAQRQTKRGFVFQLPAAQYIAFAESFPFEETADQLNAIEQVIRDMCSEKTMDRLVCGDVGFGKTEVAMRAAFLATQNHQQTAVLVPTTLLAEQHFETFKDRFANWPVRIEAISRFRSSKEQVSILSALKEGKIDIIIGTHKLLQKEVEFHQLGLLIIDEEHRFGVQQKEQIKSLRAEVDILSLTATPIPRTLNMALSTLRDLSIIATPPENRLAIKTFVCEKRNYQIREAVLREILRGGQVYYLHNEVATIHRTADALAELIPEAKIEIAHGQMREHELEQVMVNFYHRRFHILLCTTIIESGIDVPSANTIIIDRADKLGLAQLHQLRGRVGRSHHQAYAYLLIPSRKDITKDAVKRLDAIESLEELGVGFLLANHDLEIRGAGELLGEEQSGQMQEIGFDLYMEMLQQAIEALKIGKTVDLAQPFAHRIEIDLQTSAFIPEDYLPDAHARLVWYKRIAHAKNLESLDDLRIEMIDRLGLLPEKVMHLFDIAELRLMAESLGLKKIEANAQAVKLTFTDKPAIDPVKILRLIQSEPTTYQLKGSNSLRVILPVHPLLEREGLIKNILEKLQTLKA